MNKVPIFSYFLCKIPNFFLFSGIANSYFPIFSTIPITWRPENETCNRSTGQIFYQAKRL